MVDVCLGIIFSLFLLFCYLVNSSSSCFFHFNDIPNVLSSIICGALLTSFQLEEACGPLHIWLSYFADMLNSDIQAVISACRTTRLYVDQFCDNLINQSVTIMAVSRSFDL